MIILILALVYFLVVAPIFVDRRGLDYFDAVLTGFIGTAIAVMWLCLAIAVVIAVIHFTGVWS